MLAACFAVVSSMAVYVIAMVLYAAQIIRNYNIQKQYLHRG